MTYLAATSQACCHRSLVGLSDWHLLNGTYSPERGHCQLLRCAHRTPSRQRSSGFSRLEIEQMRQHVSSRMGQERGARRKISRPLVMPDSHCVSQTLAAMPGERRFFTRSSPLKPPAAARPCATHVVLTCFEIKILNSKSSLRVQGAMPQGGGFYWQL